MVENCDEPFLGTTATFTSTSAADKLSLLSETIPRFDSSNTTFSISSKANKLTHLGTI